MPFMSGFEILEGLKAIAPRFARVPFIFLTAMNDRNDELKGRLLGADDYVAKPIDFNLLHAIINARIRSVARMQLWPTQHQLSDREIEALMWAARGKTSGRNIFDYGYRGKNGQFPPEQRTGQIRRGDPYPGRRQGDYRRVNRAIAAS